MTRCCIAVAVVALCAASCPSAGQGWPGGGPAMPAIVQRPATAASLEMWRRSASDASVLLRYLDREAVRKTGVAPPPGMSLLGLLRNLEYLATERLGDIGGPELVPRLEAYIAQKVAAEELDAAAAARCTVDRIRLRAQGRQTYVQEMVRWVQTPEPPPDSSEQECKNQWRRVVDGARALGVMGAVEAVPVLLARRQKPGWTSTELGLYLVRALARLDDARALETMRNLLLLFAWYMPSAQQPLEPEEPDVAWSYWHIRTRGMTLDRSIQELVASMAEDPGQLGAHKVLELIGAPAVPALIQALSHPPQGPHPEWAQSFAVRVLGDLRAADAVPALRALLRDAGSPRTCEVARALGQIGDRAALPELILAASSPDALARSAAVGALGDLGDPGAEATLLGLLGSADSATRYDAVDALAKCGTAAAATALEAHVDSEPSPGVRGRMRLAIARLRSK